MKINSYDMLEDVVATLKEKNLIVDLSGCNNNRRVRILDFLSGLVFHSGEIIKLDKDNFKIIFKK